MKGFEVYLVADRFAEFATQPGVQTVGQFLEEVTENTGNAGPTWLRRGQGVTDADWREIAVELARANLLDRVAVQGTAATPVPVSAVHKAHEDNVLIADLREVSAGRFAANLRLAANNELLIDHTTGQHVPGIVIIEAARQMMMAVSNAFYLPLLANAEYRYVLDSIECHFERYLFPLNARLELTMISVESTRRKRMQFQAEVAIRQAGMTAAACTARYLAYESEALARYERTLGGRTISALRENIDRVVRTTIPTAASVPSN